MALRHSYLTALLLSFTDVQAGCCLPLAPAECFAEAEAVAELEARESISSRNRDGQIITRHTVRVLHSFKGDLPNELSFETFGGRLGPTYDYRSDQPLIPDSGTRFIAHLSRCAAGQWHVQPFNLKEMPDCATSEQALRDFFNGGAITGSSEQVITSDQGTSGGSPQSRITTTGYSENSSGLPSRFLSCDRGEPIGYLIDVIPGLLPSGISQADAIAAVEECLAVWATNTSLSFRYDGTTTFSQAANNLAISDGRIRIQLHDNYGNQVTASTVLGIGGGSFSDNAPPRDASGGVLDGQAFTERLRGYVVINHPSTTSLSLTDFKELLSHEIGHSLGLVHSSEDENEPVAELEDATMYFKLHKDNRGSEITDYDSSHIQCAYPEDDNPPFSTDRLLRAVSGFSQATGLGVDRIEVAGRDLQSQALTVEHLSTYDANLNGTFSQSGNQLIFLPNGAYSDSLLSDSQIANGTFYDQCYFRLSDGTNSSPPYTFRITGFHFDSSPSDGLPNSWMTSNFGTTSPGSAGDDRHPDSDPDGDGVDNRTERYLGSDPNDAASGPPAVTFDSLAGTMQTTPTRFISYRFQSSIDLQNWTNESVFSQFDSPTSLSFDAPAPTEGGKFYRFAFGP